MDPEDDIDQALVRAGLNDAPWLRCEDCGAIGDASDTEAEMAVRVEGEGAEARVVKVMCKPCAELLVEQDGST